MGKTVADHNTATLIKRKAVALGFDLCGITTEFEPTHGKYFSAWLEAKRFAGMEWLGRNIDKRTNPGSLLPEARSAVVVAASYNHETDWAGDYALARYAYGADYHDWMRMKLNALAGFISNEAAPGTKCRSFVDTGPVLERDLAAKAGLGWIGKNTCLINRDLGSYAFLGILFTDVTLPVDAPATDQCAECRLCLDACPTGALGAYRMDPGKCLAYHNIELRGERPREFRASLGDHLIGCDICQEVCPWNHRAPDTRQKDWLESFARHELGDLRNILQMSATDYKTKTKGSAISRVKYEDFMRNVLIVIANTGRHDLRDDVLKWREKNPGMSTVELESCLEII